MTEELDVQAIADEIACGNFSDPRLVRRLRMIMEAAAAKPSTSLPKMFKSAGELEAAYRFFANPMVTLYAILAPHFDATRERARRESCVRALHDQTEFAYRRQGHRQGLSEGAYQSFSAHVSLLVSGDEHRRPLGLAGIHTWIRGGDKGVTAQSFWLKQIRATAQMLGPDIRPVHICDRGAEDFVLLHELLASKDRFVIRVGNRYTESGPGGEHMKLREVMATVAHLSERSAKVNPRRRESDARVRKIHPPRDARTVELNISACSVVLARPSSKAVRARGEYFAKTIEVNAVRVWEPNPPAGETPIEWFLFTNEPIATAADLCAIVEHYRARWVIEEYFKALKSGCSFEKRQLGDYEGLVNALGVFAPLAYNVLLLRTKARATPDAPASTVASEEQIEVLRALGRRKLPDRPTARDVLLAVAALGGHIQYAPDPGWLTISRGYEDLELLTRGWRAGKLQQAYDQR